MTNYDVIKKLIGEIEPIGDSRVDEKRFENLMETTLLVEQLLRDIHAVVSFSDCSQASMNKAGRWAKECLDGFRKDLITPTAIVEPAFIPEGHFKCYNCKKILPNSMRQSGVDSPLCTDCAPF